MGKTYKDNKSLLKTSSKKKNKFSNKSDYDQLIEDKKKKVKQKRRAYKELSRNLNNQDYD